MISNHLLPVLSDPASLRAGLSFLFLTLSTSLRMIGILSPLLHPNFIYTALLGTDSDLYEKESAPLIDEQRRTDSALFLFKDSVKKTDHHPIIQNALDTLRSNL